MNLLRLAGALADVPVRPDREGARGLAVEELAKREYQAQQPSIWQRVLDWLGELFDGVRLPQGPGSALLVGIVTVVLAALLAYVLWRSGGLGRRVRTGEAGMFTAAGPRSPAEHRVSAHLAAGEGDWRTAVLERFRAVVRELEERTVLVPQPGRTADEASREAGATLPQHAEALMAAARLFDDVRYGDRAASPEAYQWLADVDDAVRTAPVGLR